MSFRFVDYGKDVVTINGDDIFFLDTNIVITYLYKDSEYHEATALFLKYLLYKNAILCISEVVVMEAVNGLARMLYIDDQIAQNGKRNRSFYRRQWGRHVIKRDPVTLSTFNEKAAMLIDPFLNVCVLVESNEEQVRNAINLSVTVPLGSADSLILSSALSVEATGILSLDGDMTRVREIPIYSTTIKNADFDELALIKRLGLDFETYLTSILGDTES